MWILGATKVDLFDIRVCHPNADSYKHLTPEQVYRLHENEKKKLYERRVLEVEEASFMALVFTTTGGMGRGYHSRLAELISIKKGKDYARTSRWIRGKVFFSILRSELLCLRGSRSIRRRAFYWSGYIYALLKSPCRLTLVIESYPLSFFSNRLTSTLMSIMTKITSILIWSMSCNDSRMKETTKKEKFSHLLVKNHKLARDILSKLQEL